MTNEQLIKALADIDPAAVNEIDGDLFCFFCSAYIVPLSRECEHDADCIWLAAKQGAPSVKLSDIPAGEIKAMPVEQILRHVAEKLEKARERGGYGEGSSERAFDDAVWVVSNAIDEALRRAGPCEWQSVICEGCRLPIPGTWVERSWAKTIASAVCHECKTAGARENLHIDIVADIEAADSEVERLKEFNAELCRDNGGLRADNAALRAENDRLNKETVRSYGDYERLCAENDRLKIRIGELIVALHGAGVPIP